MKTMYDEVLMELQDCLERYDCIFAFCNNTKLFESSFAQSSILNNTKKRVWIYSCNKILYPEQISHVCISPEEEKILLEIYRTYEFSDRFHVVGSNAMYGSLFHYMDIGVLSAEEVIKALLY